MHKRSLNGFGLVFTTALLLTTPSFGAQIFFDNTGFAAHPDQTIDPATSSSSIEFNDVFGTATSDLRVKFGDFGLRTEADGHTGGFTGAYGILDLLTFDQESGFLNLNFQMSGTLGSSRDAGVPGKVSLFAAFSGYVVNMITNDFVAFTVNGAPSGFGVGSPSGSIFASGGAAHNLVLHTTPSTGTVANYTPGSFTLTGNVLLPFSGNNLELAVVFNTDFFCGIEPGPGDPASCNYKFDSFNSALFGGAQVLDPSLNLVPNVITSESGYDYAAALPSEVPEPSTWVLTSVGLLALFARRFRRSSSGC